MAQSFCNIKRSVAWMVLMVALSNARPRVSSSSSADAGDANCAAQRIESRLSRIEAQLSRMSTLPEIVASVNNNVIKENCTVDLASYGMLDAERVGYIKTSGGSSVEIPVTSEPNFYRGITVMELDAATCTTKNQQSFDTFQNDTNKAAFLETMESAPAGRIILGITADTPEYEKGFQNFVGPFFKKYYMNIDGMKYRGKFAFIMQKGYPQKTKFEIRPDQGPSLRMRIAVGGSSVYNVTFKLVRVAKARLG